jgi:aromatic ring-opening dioxygenase catalytic subunit (LigB family)
MKRKDFLKSVIGLSSMATLGSFKNLTTDWKEQDEQMPVLFVGHGSPMNAIEDNESFKKLILENNYKDLIGFEKYSTALRLSAPTPDHYLPMLYAIALRGEREKVDFFNDAVIGGSFSMTSLKISAA